MRFLWIYLCFISFFINSVAQNNSEYSIAFYNVENLFDVKHDSLKHDEEFVKGGYKKWIPYRMYQKINGISKVILAANQWNPPQLIGLCEIENDFVLRQLIYHSGLNHLNYRYIHFESPDKRGIDVALLYRHNQFEILTTEPINVSDKTNDFYTRDILSVKGVMHKTDTLHVFINHWPSKRGGELASEPKRLKAAQILSYKLDSINLHSEETNLVIMGDFNAEYESNSIKHLFKNHPVASIIHSKPLVLQKVPGTHKYQGHWSLIDHIFISKHLIKQFDVNHQIIQLPFLLEEDKTYSGYKPKRTYLGPRYHGGISDHLPVMITFKRKGNLSPPFNP